MATVTVAVEKVLHGEAMLYTWTPLTSANADGSAITAHEYGDRTVQITGTFDGATVTLQGSNDGTNWVALTDPQGNGIAKTAAALESVMETPRFTRVITTGGAGSQSITVTLFCRRTRR